MANQQSAFGFKHIGYLGGGAPDYAMATRKIQSTNTVKIFFGDPVVKNPASAYITAATLNTTSIVGIFGGCSYIPTSGGPPVWSPFWPGGSAQDAVAYIINAPSALFLAAVLNTAVTSANIGANIGFSTGAGSTVGGAFSGYTLDQSTLNTTNTLPFTVVDLYQGVGNGADPTTAYNWVQVTFNNDMFRAGVTGVL
jgi:hypothetical protein